MPAALEAVQAFADGGGELLVCPICVTARKLDADAFVPNALVAGATPMWEWLGDEAGTVDSPDSVQIPVLNVRALTPTSSWCSRLREQGRLGHAPLT